MYRFDKNNPTPLYYQIVEIVKDKIRNKELNPGDPLPTEQWFSEQYDVSRVTIRKAMSELILLGIIERVRGKSPVVAMPKYNRKFVRLNGLHEEMQNSGMTPTSEISDVVYRPAQGIVAKNLHVEEGEKVLSFRRLRFADGIPFADQIIYLREKFCPDFDPQCLTNQSLYAILENEYGLKIDYADQTLSVKRPNLKQMEDLQIHDKLGLMQMKRTTYLDTGEVIEYTEICYVAERYEFSLRLYR
jgi:Transcriptional regulators